MTKGSTSGDTITLGMIGPLTGSLAVYGTHIEKGVKLSIKEINAADGVTLSDEAYQLNVETKDDRGDSTECVNAMNVLISDGPARGRFRHLGCTSAITLSGTADSLTTAMNFVSRICFRDSFQGELAAYAKGEGYTKVGIVYCSAIHTSPACGTHLPSPAASWALRSCLRNLWPP